MDHFMIPGAMFRIFLAKIKLYHEEPQRKYKEPQRYYLRILLILLISQIDSIRQ